MTKFLQCNEYFYSVICTLEIRCILHMPQLQTTNVGKSHSQILWSIDSAYCFNRIFMFCWICMGSPFSILTFYFIRNIHRIFNNHLERSSFEMCWPRLWYKLKTNGIFYTSFVGFFSTESSYRWNEPFFLNKRRTRLLMQMYS